MIQTLSVTEAARHFAEYINRAAYRGECFVLVRGNKPVAELRPLPMGKRLAELPALLASLPHLTPDEATQFVDDLRTARAELAAVGNIIERNGLWLAATCITHGLTCLVTGILAVPPDILFISQPLSPMALKHAHWCESGKPSVHFLSAYHMRVLGPLLLKLHPY